jgi:hypothetical protein
MVDRELLSARTEQDERVIPQDECLVLRERYGAVRSRQAVRFRLTGWTMVGRYVCGLSGRNTW